jgi:hypothetical protein
VSRELIAAKHKVAHGEWLPWVCAVKGGAFQWV